MHWKQGVLKSLQTRILKQGRRMLKQERHTGGKLLAVAILPSTAIHPQRLFCRELFVIGQSKWRTKHVTFGRSWLVNFKNQLKNFCTPRSLSPTLYTPFQCTLPHTFTYQACPFSVHTLSFNALPAEIRTHNHGISRPAHYPLHHSVTGVIVANMAI